MTHYWWGVPDDAIVQATTTGLPVKVGAAAAAAATLHEEVTVTLPMPEEQREGYLEIRRAQTETIVTVVELLSPKNKHPGTGRQQYEAKRQQVLRSLTYLVEIDLLRQWPPMPLAEAVPSSHYRILVSRSDHRPPATLYPFNLATPIPRIAIPLATADPVVFLDLQALLHEVYDLGSFDLRLDYGTDPPPPLRPTDRDWVAVQLTAQGLHA